MPQDPQDKGVIDVEFRAIFTMMAQVITNQVNQGDDIPHASTLASRLRDFVRMNPLEFHGSMVEKDV